MDTLIAAKLALRGGEFLIKDSEAADVFIPEEFDEEQVMMRDAVRDFVDTEIRDRKSVV